MITNIYGGSSTAEGETVVNELCQTSTTSSVNVRSGPGTMDKALSFNKS